MVDRRIATARSAAERFSRRLTEEDDFSERLAYEYNLARQALAASFQSMSRDALDLDSYSLDAAKRRVDEQMQSLFGGKVDSSLLKVRGYGSTHPVVFALLAERLGDAVPAWRLRVLTADAIHTERRTRELRDLGLDIQTSEQDGTPTYTLTSLDPDLTYGAAYQLRRNATDTKRIPSSERKHIVQLAEATAILPEKRATS